MFLKGWSPTGSAPNSVGPSPAPVQEKKSASIPTEEEMKRKVQYMLSLQYAAQQQDQSHGTSNPQLEESSRPPKGRSIMNVPYPQNPQTHPQQEAAAVSMEGVGQGHMYFPSDYPKPTPQEHQPILSSGDAAASVPHYGGPAFHDTTIDDPDHVEPKENDHHYGGRHTCCCIGCCLRFVNYWKKAEALHRSFCFGAIDGVLTGSSIVATFLGMGILTAHSPMSTRVLVVAFSLAACTSDAICMALGHVWSTHVIAHASANERRKERLSFEQNRADAKGKLVDMLLSRGMLKIDAMSIADTLEGYPDVFVSALVGDSGHMLGEDSLSSGGSSSGLFNQTGFHPDEGQMAGLRARRSYGQFNEEWDDPEAASVKIALGESRTEGVVMMSSFTLFSVVPSLLFLWLSTIMKGHSGHSKSGGTSVTSVTVFLTSTLMLLLGFWKSKFFESNWILFGIESVLLLLLCAMTAFFIGACMVALIPCLSSKNSDGEL